MINSKTKIGKLIVSVFLLIIFGIASGYVIKTNAAKKSVETSTLQNTALQKTSNIRNISAAVVRKNELLSVSLDKRDKNIVLDSGGTFSRPIISPDKKHVSYLKDNILYITSNQLSHIKISNSVSQLSFVWQDKNTLLYSPASGGLYVYDIVNTTSKPLLQNKYNYQNITLDKKERIYAEQYLYYIKNGEDYRNDYGILFFNPVTKEKKIVIKSIPSKIDTGGDLGMYPIITGISKDGYFLTIWKHPHAGSLAADGVDLAVYDILNNKLMEYATPNIISLPYEDNISLNPKDSRYLTLIYGTGREMGDNKKLIVLDILTGKFQSLSPKGEASMTPFYSSNGKMILYASSKEQRNITGAAKKWLLNGKHHIFSIDTTTKQIKQLTNNTNYFDFSPIYINNKDIIFFRNDENQNISVWKYTNGLETMLADKLIFYDDMSYPIQNYNGHFNTSLFTDIK
jgi:hypothetical protein